MVGPLGNPYAEGIIEARFTGQSPSRFDRDTAVWLLLPGISPALMQRLLRRSAATVLSWRRRATKSLVAEPSIGADVRRLSDKINASDGVWLARNRGMGPLPFWSRLAIKSMWADGLTHGQLAEVFAIHERTARNVCSGRFGAGFDALSGVRRPTAHQSAPPGRWR